MTQFTRPTSRLRAPFPHRPCRTRPLSTAPFVLAAVGLVPPAAADSTDAAMYFHSQVKDAATCAMTVTETGTIAFPYGISAPAATCPDASGWRQFLEAIQSEFWVNWGNDETLWVKTPKALCADDFSTDCCFVDPTADVRVGYRDASGTVVKPDDIGGPGAMCPYIPADWGGSDETTFAGGKPVTSHNSTFLRTLDPARIARQREVEVVYRNDPFMIYATGADIYSKAGLKTWFDKVSGEAANAAPYRPTGQGVSFPSDAVMFKVDWIPEATMIELGYISDHDDDPSTPPQDPDNPYVTMKINASTDDGKTYTEGLYYLAAITGASKALPNWHWYAFEHVNNLGRCDFTGCNDSYGYRTTVEVPSPTDPEVKVAFDSNFIRPHTMDDQLKDDTALFDRGKRYPSGTLQAGLAALFDATGIGSGAAPVDPDVPATTDPAWKSYRLKGTQTRFYSRDGYAINVGASITEAGFVNTASCMSCHVQASIDKDGNPGTSVGATAQLSLSGIGKVVQGAPYVGDYFMRGTTKQHAVQFDFVWGILFAE